MPKIKEVMDKNVALGEPIEHHAIFTWLVEALFYVSKIGRIDGFHSDEDPLASRGRDQINYTAAHK